LEIILFRGLGRKLGEGVQFTITVIGGFVYAFYESWEVSLIVLAVVPLMGGSASFMLAVSTKQTERKNKNYAETGGIVYSTISAIRTVFSLNAAEKMIADFQVATKKAQDSAIAFTIWVGLGNGSLMGSFLVSYIALTLYGSFKLYSQVRATGCDPSNTMGDSNDACPIFGRQVFGALMGISFGAMGLAQIGGAVEALMGSRAACHPALLAIERQVGADDDGNEGGTRIVDEPADVEGGKAAFIDKKDIILPKYVIDSSSDAGKKLDSVDGEIVFQNVSFAYPTRPDSLVFDELNLTIKAGQTVALVGPRYVLI
jgi:ATP-binding cassette subfamily B (MDR/TAP) protein 1